MKVVLFCGGLGMRLREYSETIPKPMVPLGSRPILWHLMKYYAHYGHREFILCLGWKGDAIKEYFLQYNECVSNDFIFSRGGTRVTLLNSDIDDWTITFVDTGTTSNIGSRLKAIQPHLDGEEIFLANYADGLCDVPLPEMVQFAQQRRAFATFLAIKPRQSFHLVGTDTQGFVRQLDPVSESDYWLNGGDFVLRQEIFDYLHEGDELVVEPFQRLITRGKLCALKYEGFWSCMDTYKEKQALDDMVLRGDTPWQVWRNPSSSPLPVTDASTAGLGVMTPLCTPRSS